MKIPSSLLRSVPVPALLMAALAVLPSAPAARPALPGEEEVTFAGAGGLELHGTLVLPPGAQGRVPALLLLPGSGPTDRNGNQPPLLVTDVLRQVADALSEVGVASLRFDKRAAHVHAADWPADLEAQLDFFSYESFVGDARAALEWLAARPEVDAERVGVVGHSEGGLFALQLARERGERDLATPIVLLATAGRRLDDVVREQITDLLALQRAGAETTAEYLGLLDQAMEAIRAGEPIPELPAGLAPLFPPSALRLLEAYFTVDPAELAPWTLGPALVLNGTLDSQISPDRDALRLARALGERPDGCHLSIVPGASHNLKAVAKRTDPGFTGPVLPAVLEAITGWARAELVGAP